MVSGEPPDTAVELSGRHTPSISEIASPVPTSKELQPGSGRESSSVTGSQFLPAVGIFLFVTVLLGLTTADRLVSALDEGIYLEGAERIIAGQVPYRDFFVLTGPGSFWLQAGTLRLLGLSFIHARLILVIEVAFLAAAVFWCTAHLRARKLAALTTFLFVAFETANPGVFTINHRWDSSALGVAAVMLLFSSLEQRVGWARVAIAGVLAALAVWATPTLLALALAILFALVLARRARRLPLYAVGLVAGFLAPALILWRQGALLPMIHHFLWTGSNYPSANGFSYGHLIGGYPAAMRGSSLTETAIRVLIVFVIAIPVLLPLFTIPVWTLRLWHNSEAAMPHRRQLLFLLVASVGLWLSSYPWFVGQLTSTAPLCYILGGVLLTEFPARSKARSLLRSVFLVSTVSLGLVFLLNTVRPTGGVVMQTRVGRIRAGQEDAKLIGLLSEYVGTRDMLFVFPYKPILYFITGATNPTRYSFLQPGMMTDTDERNALADLVRTSPRWILYEDVPSEAYLRIWPTSDPKRLRMQLLENFIRDRYHSVRQYRSSAGFFELKELNQH